MPISTHLPTTLFIALCAGGATGQAVPPTPFADFGAITKSDFLNPDGFFTIDTCGSDFDTEIGFWDRRGELDGSSDDALGGPCNGTLQSFLGFQFPPGVYYFSVSGFDTEFGDDFSALTFPDSNGGNAQVRLDVENGLETFQESVSIAPGDGVIPGEVKYFRFIVPGVFEASDLGTVSTDGFVSINTNGSDFDTEIGVWNLDTGELIESDDDGGTGTRSALDLRLPTGRYAMSVSGFQTFFADGFTADTTFDAASGNAAGDINGVAFADVVSEGGEAEWYTFDVLALPAGALAEGEADCAGLGNGINDGCNLGGAFGSISMGQTIVGTGGGGLNGDPLDEDWYELVVTDTTDYTLSIESEFPFSYGFATQFTPGVAGCGNFSNQLTGRSVNFGSDSFTGTLQPGTYYVVVTNLTGSEPSECGSQYALTIRPQIPDCPAGSIEESEPVPFDDFITLGGSTNDECIITGDELEDISIGDTVCGTTGTYADSTFGTFGDQDFYRFNVAAPTVVEAEIVSTTSVRTALTGTPLPVADPCSVILAGGDATVDAEPGKTARVRLALQPGDHSLVVLAEPFAQSGTASGSPYIVSLNEYTCRADTNLDGFVTPADFNAWILAFNSQGVVCDQNGDGLCTPADFNAWIFNFNSLAGCGS